MRVIAGRFRGRPLRSARTRELRPTADRVREAVFSILGDAVVDARVLDLYAGTGALALEAMSRGAREATCVERDRRAIAALETNVEALGVGDRVSVVRGSAVAFVRRLGEEPEFDLVLCDPPYATPLEPIVRDAVDRPWWTTAFVLEHAASRPVPAPATSVRVDERRYGDTAITIFWRS